MSARFPLEPLAALCGGMAAMERMGFDSGELHRARRNGIGIVAADRWAVRAGYHPSLVWSEWFDAVNVECEADDCTNRFLPSPRAYAGKHRFCSPQCRARVAKRRQRATVAGREANRAACRRYYASNGDYERKQRRSRARARRTA